MSTDIIPLPPESEPPQNLRLAIIYNPFDITDVAVHELIYDPGKSLDDYMQGLPLEVTWAVSLDGVLVEVDKWAETFPAPGSSIALIRIPEGGSTGKTILRIVALIAVVVAAAVAGPAAAGALGLVSGTTAFTVVSTLVTAVTGLAGALLVNTLLPAQTNQPTGSPSYSVNGPVNTAREGVPVPIVYGQWAVGGNITDMVTQNVNDDQYLFIRMVLNDGISSNVDNILINNQPITDFEDVEYRIALGNPGQDDNDWFTEAIRLNEVNERITTSGVFYTTIGDVDRIRVDVSFPLGMSYTSGSGKVTYSSVQLAINIMPLDEDANPIGSWGPMPLQAPAPIDTSPDSGTFILPANVNSAKFSILPSPDANGNYSVQGFYRPAADDPSAVATYVNQDSSYQAGTWIPYNITTGTEVESWYSGQADPNGDIPQPTQQQQQLGADVSYGVANAAAPNFDVPMITYQFNFPMKNTWEVMFTGGSIQDNQETGIPANSASGENVPGQVNTLDLYINDQNAFNVTYQSETLTRGRYAVQVTRAIAEDTNPLQVNQCWVSDIGEIDNENVQYPETTLLSVKIKQTNQLSGVPNIVATVDGALCNTYDEEGNVVSTEWTTDPAWICADILCNPVRGAGYDPSKIDWPAMVAWSANNVANGYQFNGVFDFVTTVWDAINTVARLGHAYFVPVGSKWSPVIDMPADPVMIFTGSNMFKNTFSKTWVKLSDRANEIQQQYYDQTDLYRQKTVRLPNAYALSSGLPAKPATTAGIGINNVAQATAEAEYQARKNSYITNTVSFDAPLEACALSLGDVVLIQHDSYAYADGVGGRIAPGSTSTVVNLDRPVTMNEGYEYALMVVQSAVQVYDCTVSAINGNRVTVSGGNLPSSGGLATVTRLQQNGNDVDITYAIDQGNGVYRLTLDDASSIQDGAVTLWATDVIEQYAVEFVAGESTSVTLQSPLIAPPCTYANFLFGQLATVQQPYRLKAIRGSDDLSRRTLQFENYDPRVYEPGSWGVPTIVAQGAYTVAQVTNCFCAYNTSPDPSAQQIAVTVSWNAPQNTATVYGGADVYYQLNDQVGGGDWEVAGSVSNVTQWQGNFSRGDAVVFKVVCYDSKGNRANFTLAPVCGTTVNAYVVAIDPPTNLAFNVPIFTDLATVSLTWTASDTADANTTYQIEYEALSLDDYTAMVAVTDGEYAAIVTDDAGYSQAALTSATSYSIPSLEMGTYSVRVRAVQGYSPSNWVYLPVQIGAPGIPVNITNLRIAGHSSGLTTDTFVGPDCTWVWDDILTQANAMGGAEANGLPFYWQDYEITILDTSGHVIRVDYTSSPTYTYTYAANSSDYAQTGLADYLTLARRAFTIEVCLRGKQGQLSTPVTQSVSNPPPALEAVTTTLGVAQITLSYAPSTDTDFAGIIVWGAQNADFNPGGASPYIVYEGPGNAVWNVPAYVDYYYAYAFYDMFGLDSLNISNIAMVYTTGASSSIIDPSVMSDITTLIQEVSDGQDTAVNDAANSASAAAASAAAALESEGEAQEAAGDAQTYASQAQASQTSASTSASDAATSAGNASESATTADGSAATASTQASDASNSANSASGSASAAASSATQAASSATAAASSATVAQNSADTATDQAGLAESYATSASGSAATASSSAASALNYATLAASVGETSLVIDPTFVNWPAGQTYPTGWEAWTSGTTSPQQGTGIYSPYSVIIQGAAGSDLEGMAAKPGDGNTGMGVGQIAVNDYVVLEADVTLLEGTLQGAGLTLLLSDSGYNNLGIELINFYTDADVSGSVVGAGVAGTTYHFRKLCQITYANTAQAELYAFAHGSGFTGQSIAGANSLAFQRASVRFASGAEITAGVASVDAATALAQIAAEQSARIAGDNANAESINDVSATVGDLSASVSTNTTAIATLAGQAYGSYTLEVNANGAIASMQLLAIDGPTSTSAVIFDVDSFGIEANGQTTQPFVYNTSTDTLALQNCQVTGALVVGAIASPTGQTRIDVENGQITFNNGVSMKVTGVGFGANSDLLEWFGPSMPINQCTKLNASWYLGIDGSSYFGGNLNTGNIVNGTQTTNTASNAQTQTLSFGSTGNAISVTVVYNCNTFQNTQYSSQSAFTTARAGDPNDPVSTGIGTWNATGVDSATIQIYRGVAGGAMSLYQTLSVSGSWNDTWNDNGDSWSSTQKDAMSGTITFTDPDRSVETRQYYAVITERYLKFSADLTQTLSITTVEQDN